jgi:hypothetical protein
MEESDLNDEAITSAYKQIAIHNEKIEELDLYSDLTEDEVDDIIKNLSEIKAISEGKTIDEWKKYSTGQQFYVTSLIKEISMTDDELFDFHYRKAFADVGSLAEKKEMISQMRTNRSTRKKVA